MLVEIIKYYNGADDWQECLRPDWLWPGYSQLVAPRKNYAAIYLEDLVAGIGVEYDSQKIAADSLLMSEVSQKSLSGKQSINGSHYSSPTRGQHQFTGSKSGEQRSKWKMGHLEFSWKYFSEMLISKVMHREMYCCGWRNMLLEIGKSLV
ncbi:down syndrome cell adhesion molecule [Caerostris darwini]|uniref:Down syndrome cell adhesion molecule n=1 Tax=Caerostris darwini TaxID=1538125 RepID=A0AAV4RTH7_9ARAC|nr:down syndrome cell adhesion molecule [Caerostris darwini]